MITGLISLAETSHEMYSDNEHRRFGIPRAAKRGTGPPTPPSFMVDECIESQISSGKSPIERRIGEMLETLQPEGRLGVSDVSRLGCSRGQMIQILDTLAHRKIRFIAIKEGIEFDGRQALRTQGGLAAAKAQWQGLERAQGTLGISRLDDKEQDIRALLS